MKRVCVTVAVIAAMLMATTTTASGATTSNDRFDPDLFWYEVNTEVLAIWWQAGWDAAVASTLADAVGYLEAGRAEEAALRAAQSVSRPATSTSPSGGGDCYASQIPSYIVNRESGGNASAYNPSGAWGCFQFMPGTWNGSCSDLGPYGSSPASVQVQCANRVWAGGAGASHWAATV